MNVVVVVLCCVVLCCVVFCCVVLRCVVFLFVVCLFVCLCVCFRAEIEMIRNGTKANIPQ